MKSPYPLGGGAAVKIDIAVTHRDGSTNLDLLVVDHRNKAGIAFEVKWLNEPEGMNEVRIADREIRKGFGQAARCRDWLNARTLSVAQASGIPKQDLSNYRFIGSGVVAKHLWRRCTGRR